jgi:hypothetical protein
MREVLQWALDAGKITASGTTVQKPGRRLPELIDLTARWTGIPGSSIN